MWFRNLLPYRLDGAWGMSPGVFEKKLGARTLQPCTGLTAQTQGWVSPRDDDQLVYGQGRQLLFALGTETKLLPASVVKDADKAKILGLNAAKLLKITRRLPSMGIPAPRPRAKR